MEEDWIVKKRDNQDKIIYEKRKQKKPKMGTSTLVSQKIYRQNNKQKLYLSTLKPG